MTGSTIQTENAEVLSGLTHKNIVPNFHNQPCKIWNMDETGMTLGHKPSKVLIKKGSKAINGKTSISLEQLLPTRMQLVTIYLHFLYFPGKPDETVAVAQWARAFIFQTEGWVLESQPPQTLVVKNR